IILMSTDLHRPEEELREHFFNLKTRQDVADLLEISDYQLRYHLYISRKKAYKTFTIPKKSGEARIIHTPITPLKIIQKKLNQILRCVYQPKPSTHGFAVGRSIITNASQHLRQRYILNLDIKDFFPSINFGRVRGLYMAFPYHCTEDVATVLAQICCYENQLPQGAPTSPIVSNMICAQLDNQLQKLAKKYHCIYTRYADDITFSTSKPKFPPQLTYFSDKLEKLVIGDELEQIIDKNGFSINESKTRLKTKYKRQEVTGITVNEKLNVKRKAIRQVRAMLHAWEKYGLERAQAEFLIRFDKKQHFHKHQPSFKYIVRGKIEFIGKIRGKDDPIYLKFVRWLNKLAPELVNVSNIEFNESSLLDKYQINKISVWTEGKTDIKHLKAALRYLNNNGRTFNYEIEFKEDLDEQKQGSSELLKMCEQYCKSKHVQPIIAIFDRDEMNIIPKVHDEARGFKSWKNGVYSFALPIPQHRKKVKDLCIELYYRDFEIQRKDSEGRRLFLSNEFSSRSGRHQVLDLTTDRNKIKSEQIKIIDSDVFDREDKNVALSKNSFADYILWGEEGFNDFDFEEFYEVFKTIDNILKFHIENDGTPN
ncbi:MAG TPA: reverse transcriptase domain-containing protein, partial [Allocoleopsis sp.]